VFMNLQAVEIESILYEDAVNSLLDLMANRDAQGFTSRELHLVRTTSMLMEHLDAPGKLASIAAMSLVMLHEERKKTNDRRTRSRSPDAR
jgi:hypothetical protein